MLCFTVFPPFSQWELLLKEKFQGLVEILFVQVIWQKAEDIITRGNFLEVKYFLPCPLASMCPKESFSSLGTQGGHVTRGKGKYLITENCSYRKVIPVVAIFCNERLLPAIPHPAPPADSHSFPQETTTLYLLF